MPSELLQYRIQVTPLSCLGCMTPPLLSRLYILTLASQIHWLITHALTHSSRPNAPSTTPSYLHQLLCTKPFYTPTNPPSNPRSRPPSHHPLNPVHHRRLTKEKFYPDFYGPPKPFVAEDPEKVVEKLRRQQELFQQQNQKVLEEQKKERREAAAKLLGASTSKTFENVTYHGTEGMVNRLIDSKQKQLVREKQRAAEEQEVVAALHHTRSNL